MCTEVVTVWDWTVRDINNSIHQVHLFAGTRQKEKKQNKKHKLRQTLQIYWECIILINSSGCEVIEGALADGIESYQCLVL